MARYRSTGNMALDVGIFAGALAIAFVIHLLIQHWPKIVYCFARKTTEPARIRYLHASPISLSGDGTEHRGQHIHTASFELQDESRLQLQISHDDYIMLSAGERGMLTRKGKCFISFEPEK